MADTGPGWLSDAADDCDQVGHDWVVMFDSSQDLVEDWEVCQRCHKKQFTGADPEI